MSSTEDPPPYNHRTTTGILRHAAETTLTILPTTIFLTVLLFSFRTVLETGTVFLTSVIESDASLHSLLSRLDLSPTALPHHHHHHSLLSPPHRRRHLHRHRPFLHLTRVGTLDDDFFSSDDDAAETFPHSSQPNSTFLSLSSSSFTPALLRHRVSFAFSEEESRVDSGRGGGGGDGAGDSRFISMAGLEIEKRDAAALFFLICVLSAAYGWVIVGFVITYSWALGVVFVAVVNVLLGRYSSFSRSVWTGSNLGIKRLSGFILMRWAVRDAVTQILGLWFFSQIHDQYSFFKLFLRLKLMPFSVASPWVPGYDKEVSGFLFAWFLADTVVSFVLAVDSWVTIVNTRLGGREIVKEGCYLLATMIHQSIQLKCLELIFCGAFMRWVLARVCGKSFAIMVQSLVEVYFMVAWLIFYFASRCKDASMSGRRFGRRELEGLIEGLR
ncbi:hypothetical protein vseg_003664 [Gypsophila vaccaria]